MIEQHSHQQQGADEQSKEFPPPPPELPPTSSALTPLAQLEAYLAATTETQQQQQQSSSPSPNMDEILRVADYLLLGTSSATVNKNLLQSSLTILDEQPSKITQFTAPSGRSLYLVKGSKRETYLCLNFSSPKSNNNNKSMIGDYCSCRSFWEQHTKQQHSSSHSHNKVVCKHLLALALMHPLQCQPNQIQLNSDDEFAYLVLERMSSVGGGGESSSRSFQRY